MVVAEVTDKIYAYDTPTAVVSYAELASVQILFQ